MYVCREQVRPGPDDLGHGFAACRVAHGVDASAVDREVLEEVLRQRERLGRRRFTPVGQLWAHDDYVFTGLGPGQHVAATEDVDAKVLSSFECSSSP